MALLLINKKKTQKKDLLASKPPNCHLYKQPQYGISSILPSHWSAMIEAEKHSREVHDEDTM
ncbi:hypothetical protein KDA_24860 [Dictyobacter alpinus]|uniref:Uncharacterized protein n=1 Tax=Dictyobacter alpinus TaxID=2014873 RepID=A0A402B6N4_9CHLR|nr:hypothetical protein KDA_24860 [Dictyobacter alpinus]